MSVRELARRFAEASPSDRAFACAAFVLIAAGAVFRTSGALTTPLWNDEAYQAIALGGEPELADLSRWPLNLRPALYLLIGRLSILAHDAEWVLRLTSLVPSIASLLVTLALARLLFGSRAAVLLCLLGVSLNPWLVDFAKEYKPYALEQLLVTLQCYLAFRWLRRRSIASLRALLPVAAISPLLGFACVFVEPFLFALIAADAWRGGDRRTLALVAAGAAVTAGLFAAQYLLFQQHATKLSFQYWRENFYDAGLEPSRLGGHLFDLVARFPAGPVHWPRAETLRPILEGAHAVLFGIGIAALAARRRWQVLVVIVGPLLLPIAASLAGRWPYGMVRVNLYLIGLVILASAAAIELAAASKRLRPAALAVVAALAALQLPVEPRRLLDKQLPNAHMRPVLKATDMPALLDALYAADARELAAGSKVCVHVSAEARPVFTYYTQHHDGRAASSAERLRIGRMLSENTRHTMLEMSAAVRGDAQPCWLIRSYKYDEQLAYRRVLQEKAHRVLGEVEAPGLFATKLEREPRPIAAAADGSIVLRAEDAVLHGPGLWYYGRARIGGLQGVDPRWASEAIGNWTSARGAVSWSFEVARTSELEVLVSQAAGDGAGGSTYAVAFAPRVLDGTVQPTGRWRDFVTVSLGAVTLEPGRHTASLRVIVKRGEHVMNLRSITLRPRPAPVGPR